MTTATVNRNGQITIPTPVREALRLKTGDRVEIVEIEPGRYEFVAASRPVTALKGKFGKPKKTVTVEEMDAAIAERGASAN
ncbi:MAG: AbrB/MazE/SpoVT family DNA-binding domain-containing protein [Methylococcaceae bacterium]|nr:AbrB/MazE/SpoVT family DNA-binding domain-containing protein [Methylococcaceae bacterium]